MQKRLTMELKQIQEDEQLKSQGIEVWHKDNNLYNWTVKMQGPMDSAYQQGVFTLNIDIPEQYPFKAPIVHFVTPIYHPNVNRQTGEICQDIYSRDWAPVKKIVSIIQTIQSMLLYPQLDTPVENEIAHQFKNDQKLFKQIVSTWIEQHAQSK